MGVDVLTRMFVKFSLLLATLSLLLFTSGSYGAELVAKKPAAVPGMHASKRVRLTTDMGNITLLLYPEKAPVTVKNFLDYVDSGFYNGVIFHRVKPNFVVQTGGLTFDFIRKETLDPIVNESTNGLKNLPGTVAMARFTDPDSATSQFFINLKHNKTLDATKKKPGYTVFGRVLIGMDVAFNITKEPRGLYRGQPEAPNVPIRILKAERI